MVSPVLEQAILNPNIPDIVGAFDRGRERKRTGEERQRAEQSRTLAGQALQDRGGESLRELEGINPQLALELGAHLRATDVADINDFIRDAKIGANMLQSGDTQGFISFADQRSAAINARNGDSTITDNMNNLVKGGQADAALRQLQSFTGMIDKNKLVKLGAGDRLVDPTTRETIIGAETGDKEAQDIRKEVRSSIGKEIGTLKREAGVVKANFDKVVNLSKQIKKGNRNAVPQALVALVKLGDPGSVVSGSEMKTALNEQNAFAAITGLLVGKGVSDDVTRSITSKLDPLDPKNVRVEDLLATAESLITANVPVLQGRLASEQQRANENLTEAGIRSIFSQKTLDSIGALSNLKAGITEQPPVADQSLLPPINKPFSIGGVEIKRVK